MKAIKLRRIRLAGHVACTGEMGRAYRILVSKPEGEIPIGRPLRIWEYNTRIDLREWIKKL
jgi:hypothetical protein